MQPTRSSTPLARSLSIALLAVLTLFPLVSGGATAQHGDVSGRTSLGQAGQEPLDLPAMTLRPADLADVGVDQFGTSLSVLIDDATEAGEHIADDDIDPGSEDAHAFEDADAERYYILDLVNSSYDGADELTTTQIVQTFVLEYDDEHDAADGLDAMGNVWSGSDALAEEELSGDLGDAAFYLEGEGTDSETMEPTERTLLVFQVDNVVGGILTYNADEDGSFDQDVTEELALVMLHRVEDGLAGDVPGLSSNVVRIDRPATEVWTDGYITIDGEIACQSSRLAAGGCESFQGLVDEFNEVHRYYMNTRIAGDFDGTPQSFLSNSVRELEDEASAEARFGELHQSYATDAPDVEDLGLGDESVRWSETTDSYMYEHIMVRSGTYVIEISQGTEIAAAEDLGWAFEPSVESVQELADLQVACLEGEETCAEPVAIPDGMLPAEALAYTSPVDISGTSFVAKTRGTLQR